MRSIVPQEVLSNRDVGSYFVPMSKLVEMDMNTYYESEQAARDLMRIHPEYRFTVINEILPAGITIQWRKVEGCESSTEERSGSKSISR